MEKKHFDFWLRKYIKNLSHKAKRSINIALFDIKKQFYQVKNNVKDKYLNTIVILFLWYYIWEEWDNDKEKNKQNRFQALILVSFFLMNGKLLMNPH